MSETIEVSIESAWDENNAGGRRKIEGRKDPNNPHWCRNP
jgi:hypothetical protein